MTDALSQADETLIRLISSTSGTNIIALDKTIAAIRRAPFSFAAAHSRCNAIAERMVRAVREVGLCLPPHQRASGNRGQKQINAMPQSPARPGTSMSCGHYAGSANYPGGGNAA